MLIDKELLSIGEVAELTGVAVHTLRYWENEFGNFFSPVRTKGRQRRYTESEISKIMEIKRLLKEDKFSIAGAKQVLATEPGPGADGPGQKNGNGNGRSHSVRVADAALKMAGKSVSEFFGFQSAYSR